MHSATPPNFIDINTALTRLNLEVNVMGVVTDFLVPGPSRGRDWMSTFSISDLSYAGTSDDGLKVRFFRPMASEMPAITGTGDVVLLRGLKIKVWSGMTIGLSTHGTSWAVFPAASIPAQTPSSAVSLVNIKELRAPAPNASEMQYAISLCNSRDRSAFSELLSLPTDAAKAPLSSGVQLATRDWRDKFSLIKDLSIGSYHDLVGQVLKIYPDNGRVELYITDYTSNSLLFYYERNIDDADLSGREGDEFNYASRNSVKRKWAGPFGKMTLTVTLWPPHSYFGQHDVKENDFVHLRNVHIKFSKDSKMEGVLHSDRRYPDRIDVTILKHDEDDDRVKEVLRRKRDYSKYFSIKTVNAVNQSNALKRKEMGDDKPFSNNQAKKRRKREKEQLSKAKQHYGEEGSDKEKDLGHARTGKSRKHRTPDDSLPLQSPQTELNKNIKCSHHLINPRALSAIISLDNHANTTPNGTSYTLPFQNINSRATVRVIDFFPSTLADFAVPRRRASEYAILSEGTDSEGESNQQGRYSRDRSDGEETQWEWRFGLVLEDATDCRRRDRTKIKVYVAGQDADYLLKLDAEDLHKSPRSLDALREQLFLLWGDLEERKSRKAAALKQVDGNSHSPRKEEMPMGRPFQCCLKEYGVKRKVERKIEEGTRTNEAESGDDGERIRHDWVWERRWRMFGCTIV